MQYGTVAGFKYFRLGEAVRIHVYLSAMSEGTLTVYLDEACSKEAAVIPFTATESWEDFTAEFHGPDGIWPLFFKLSSEGSVDWVSFTLE